MTKVKVKGYGRGAVERAVYVNPEATKGATIGTDLKKSDGTIVTEEDLFGDGTDDSTDSTDVITSPTLWSLIQQIPANIVSLAALAGIGFSARISAGGAWVTRTLTNLQPNRFTINNPDGVAGNPAFQVSDWLTVKNLIPVAESAIIDANYQLIVSDEMTVDGDLDILGDLVVLGEGRVVGAGMSNGNGTPEGAITAPIGSLFTRLDGGASTTLYVKESGTGDTGWVAK